MVSRRKRILIAKIGLDGHDKGAKVVALSLRDAGFEVIYTGLHQTPEMIVNTALQEGVDLVGLSILSGNHLLLCRKIAALLAKNGIEVPLVVGGLIPDKDREELIGMGVTAIFPTGTPLPEVVEGIRRILQLPEQEAEGR